MIVKEKEVKDYLSKSKLGEYAINPYVGCPHKCRYCYASFMKRFTNHPEEWGEFIDVKICDKKIDTKKIEGKNVFMSSLFMSPIFIGITDWKAIIEETKTYINEYWFEDLNLRGSYKYDILRYVKEHYSNMYPIYEKKYIKGNRQQLFDMDNEIRDYCNKNNINYSDYFHHEEVISNKKNKKLGKNNG